MTDSRPTTLPSGDNPPLSRRLYAGVDSAEAAVVLPLALPLAVSARLAFSPSSAHGDGDGDGLFTRDDDLRAQPHATSTAEA